VRWSTPAVGPERKKGDLGGPPSIFRDWCAEQTAFPREIAEAALAQVLTNKAEAAYQRGDLPERRRTRRDAWARFTTTSPRAKQASNVTPISRARSRGTK
jgi:hypothetical protein